MTEGLALGIDAGGTYTDIVVMDRGTGEILQSIKSPTTSPDPTKGIQYALSQIEQDKLVRISLVSLATTFATNAIVEEQGAKAGLILIGYDNRPNEIPRSVPLLMVKGGHTVSGNEKESLDLDCIKAELPPFVKGLAAIAVTGFFSVRNPEHEIVVSNIIRKNYDLPVVRGHRLSMRLNAVKRATTALWNARLIPLITHLIRACSGALRKGGIHAPLMIVRGDGSLMSAVTALDRPIDTILSGPAASIIGARYLSGLDDCLVVDMGGTTTDMAIIEGGRVVTAPDGAQVGMWKTHVEAAKVRTIGLGGDSIIFMNDRKKICVGPRRVVPLCILAEEKPELITLLQSILQINNRQANRIVNPCSFYFRNSSPSDTSRVGDYSLNTDLTSEYMLWADARLWHQALKLDDYNRKGKYIRSALTPTDLRVADGQFVLGNKDASKLGRAIFARHLGMDENTFQEIVKNEIAKRLCAGSLKLVGNFNPSPDGLADRLFLVPDSSYKKVTVDIQLYLNAPVIGLGAPAPSCLPQAFAKLNTDVILPKGYDVSVAIGSIVSPVELTVSGTVRSNESGGFDLHTAQGKSTFNVLEYAIAEGRRQLEADARDQMARNYIKAPIINFTADEKKIIPKDGGEPIHLQTELQIRAIGSPDFESSRALPPSSAEKQ